MRLGIQSFRVEAHGRNTFYPPGWPRTEGWPLRKANGLARAVSLRPSVPTLGGWMPETIFALSKKWWLQKIESLSSKGIVEVACGGNHSLARSRIGQVRTLPPHRAMMGNDNDRLARMGGCVGVAGFRMGLRRHAAARYRRGARRGCNHWLGVPMQMLPRLCDCRGKQVHGHGCITRSHCMCCVGPVLFVLTNML